LGGPAASPSVLAELIGTRAGGEDGLMRPLTQLGDVYLIALIEIPQACSLKFLTCEQRSV